MNVVNAPHVCINMYIQTRVFVCCACLVSCKAAELPQMGFYLTFSPVCTLQALQNYS